MRSRSPAGAKAAQRPAPGATGQRRRYDNSARRRQAAGTRQRIVDAAVALVRTGPVRDWRHLTVRAVAERAGVNERTVYRHLGGERGLHDAVMRRLQEEAGVDLDRVALADVADITARAFDEVSTYPRPPAQPLEPTLSDAAQQRRQALLRAVGDAAPSLPPAQRARAAAALDVLWNVHTYEDLVVNWGFAHDEAVGTAVWMVRLVETAIRAGDAPP